MHTPWWSFKWIPGKCKQVDEETQEMASSNLPVRFHSEFLSTSPCQLFLLPAPVLGCVNSYLPGEWLCVTHHTPVIPGWLLCIHYHSYCKEDQKRGSDYSGQSLNAQRWKEGVKDLLNTLTFSVRELRLWSAFPQMTAWCLSFWLISIPWHNSRFYGLLLIFLPNFLCVGFVHLSVHVCLHVEARRQTPVSCCRHYPMVILRLGMPLLWSPLTQLDRLARELPRIHLLTAPALEIESLYHWISHFPRGLWVGMSVLRQTLYQQSQPLKFNLGSVSCSRIQQKAWYGALDS